jgi:ABC-type transporter Mla subunit MlaD
MTAPTPPVAPPVPSGPRPVSLRGGLRRLSTGLLVYGAIGIVLAVAGLIAMLYVGNRVSSLADATGERVELLIGTVEDSATVLKDAGATAISFAATLERTPPTIRQAAGTIESMRQTMLTIQSQLGALSILGSRPLGGVADQFGQIAGDLEGLDSRLDLIATDLDDNKNKLLANAASLTALGERLDDIADELRSGFIQDSLDDVRLVITVLAFLFVAWTALPAVGALLFGWWLRLELITPDEI